MEASLSRMLMLGGCLAVVGFGPAAARTHHVPTTARYAGHLAAHHGARRHGGAHVARNGLPARHAPASPPFVDDPPRWQDGPEGGPENGSGDGPDDGAGEGWIAPPGSAADNPALPV